MPVSNIYQPERIRSIGDYQNDLMAGQQNALALQTGQMNLLAQRQTLADQVAIRNALSGLGATATDDQRIQVLKGTGLPGGFSQADAIAKAQQDRELHRSTMNKNDAATDDQKVDTQSKRLSLFTQKLAGINPTDDNAIANWYKEGVDSGLVTADQAMASIQNVPADKNKRLDWYAGMLKQGLTRQQQQQAEEKLKDQALVGRGQDMTQQTAFGTTKMNNDTSRANNSATNATTMRGQNMVDSRSRDAASVAAAAPRGVITQTDAGPVLVDPRTGTSIPVTANGVPIGPKAEKLKDIPPTVNAKVMETRQSISNIDAAIDAAKKNPSAFGMENAIPGVQTLKQQRLLGGGDQNAIGARAQVANIGSLTLHDRSGAAVSASEFPRLQPFIPSAADDAAAVVTKLTRMKKIAEEELGLYSETYGEGSGYKPIRVPAPKAAGGVPDDIAAILKKHGGK